MKKITLNLEQIKNKEELYAILKRKMQLKEDNLDGMYQYLAAAADPMTLTMTGVGVFKNEMGKRYKYELVSKNNFGNCFC